LADDHGTREFLASLPQLKGFLRKPPGTVAISSTLIAVEADEADRDLEAVTSWIQEHGGRLVKPPPVQSRTHRGGRGMDRTVPADAYYVIPAAALAG
jgi:hypothetical protein